MLLHVILYVIIGDVENNNNILLYPPSLFLILSLFYFLPFFNVVLLVFFSYIFFRIYFFVHSVLFKKFCFPPRVDRGWEMFDVRRKMECSRNDAAEAG